MKQNQNLSAKKSLGQNFLKSTKAIKAMIESSNITASDVVVEIGPGKGALTKYLLETGAHVIAYELDTRMIAYLSEIFEAEIALGKLNLIHKDILDLDIRQELGKYQSYKVIANIPYYITNAIIRKFLSSIHQPTDMTLLVQKEVAERIVARDGKQSLLSLSVSIFGIPKYIMKVHKKYFNPSPKIDSAVVHISDISRKHFTNVQDEQIFFDILHAGFSHKRKMLINNLISLKEKDFWQKIFSALSISEKVRAEDISLEMWVKIMHLYKDSL